MQSIIIDALAMQFNLEMFRQLVFLHVALVLAPMQVLCEL